MLAGSARGKERTGKAREGKRKGKRKVKGKGQGKRKGSALAQKGVHDSSAGVVLHRNFRHSLPGNSFLRSPFCA